MMTAEQILSYLVCPPPIVDRNIAFYMPAQWDVTVKYCVRFNKLSSLWYLI